LLDNFVHWIREVADLSHMGVDTRMYIKKQVQTDRLVSILMRKKKEEELSDFRRVYSGLSVSEIVHNWIS
jgi:hypothetical protein